MASVALKDPLQFVNNVAEVLKPLPDWKIFIGSIAMFTALFLGATFILPKTISNRNRRLAWVISFISSAVMCIAGFYFAFRVYVTKGTILIPDFNDDNFSEIDGIIANALCIFFIAYCITDIFFSMSFYSEHVGVAYEHHIGYAVLLVYLLHSGKSVLFAVCAVEELPTLILSVYELLGDVRPRLPVGIAIFTFRMAYHLFITYKSSEMLNTPLFFFSCYLLLHHISWFRSWFFRRVAAVKDETVALGSHDATKAAAKQRKLKLEVTTHVFIVSSLLFLHTIGHGYLVGTEIFKYFGPKVDWPDRGMATLFLLFDLAGHTMSFLLVTTRMIGIVRDVYTEHFIMHTIEKRSIIYNISWEDPRVERELLNIGCDDIILTISSAGCNVLDYLTTKPKAIVACDFNQAQLAVLELKLACIEHCDYETFWEIWSESNYKVFSKVYFSKDGLRDKILKSNTPTSASTVSFWDENGSLIKDNFMFAGSSGLAARLLMPGLKLLSIVDYMVARKQYPPATIGMAILRMFLQSQFIWAWLAPLGGVPESQLALIKREPQVWAERLEEVLGRRMWMPDNYFYYAYIAGRWDKSCCPPYMQECNFKAMKDGVKRKAVTLVHGGWADGAQLRNDFTIASLLDSMDWMPDSMIAENIARLYPQLSDGTKKGSKQGVIFWRSFATKVHSPVLAALRPDHVPDLDGRERVGWYLSQWVAKVVPKVDYDKFLCEGSGNTFRNTPAQDAKVIVAMALHALRTEKSTVEFYRSQGDAYDGFRESLLPGRDVLQHFCLPWHRKPKTWISVGCGTARDIEYVIGHLKDVKTHLYLLDLSPDLLQMAKERVEKQGIGDQVTLVVADILKAYNKDGTPNENEVKYLTSDCKPLPSLGECDLVTCSYCLTMIPPWKAALEVMVEMLQKGGTLSMIDFTKREDMSKHWTQSLNQWWFSHDGVYFNEEHTAWLKNQSVSGLKTIWYQEAESRVPFTPLQATHYIWTGYKL
jgi:ubiquinone/menaquinone biosynthesis C-methylase UbiE